MQGPHIALMRVKFGMEESSRPNTITSFIFVGAVVGYANPETINFMRFWNIVVK